MGRTSKTTAAKIVKLAPDLRIVGAATAFAALSSAAGERHERIVLDARKVEKVDAAGVKAVLAGRAALSAAGKSVEWAGQSTQLESAAELLGLREALGLTK